MSALRAVIIVALISSNSVTGNILERSLQEPECPLQTNCVCEDYDGGHDIWCPDKTRHEIRFQFLTGKLRIICNHEVISDVTQLILLTQQVNIGSVDMIVYEHCPIPDESYSKLMDAMNATEVKALRITYGTTDAGGSLVAKQFFGLSELVDLELRNLNAESGETNLDPKVFEGLDQLKYLSLTGNGIADLPEDVLSPLPSLEVFHILEKSLTNLPDKLFKDSSNIKEVKIKGDRIRRLSKDLFSGLTSLTTLNLISMDFGRIGNATPGLEAGVFTELTSLANFSLTGRGLDLLPERLFSGSKKLERLEFLSFMCNERPPCNVVPPKIVTNMTSLQVFKLNRPIRASFELPEDFFWGCSNLREVEIQKAGLKVLPPALFRDTKRLSKLDLSMNSIESLPDNLFANTRNLNSLILKDNALTELKLQFNRTNNLEYLDLSLNNLSSLHQRSFISNSKLETLNISTNYLQFNSTTQPTWDHLANLKNIDLSRNKISLDEIPYEWRYLANNLRTVNISHNSLGPTLSTNDFDFKQNEIFLDISNNLIQTIVFDDLPPAVATEDYYHSRKTLIEMSYNPIDCSCEAFTLAQMLQWKRPNQTRARFFIKAENLLCQTPSQLQSQLVKKVDLEKLSCPFPSSAIPIECPEQCSCSYGPASPAKVIIDCSSKNLVKVPSYIPIVKDAREVYLDLSNNNLTTLVSVKETVGNFSKVVRLNLGHNQISNIRVEDIPSNLTNLYLDDNLIQTLSADLLNRMEKIEMLKLGNNQYRCSCEARDLFEFIEANRRSVMDLSNVTLRCGSDGQDVAIDQIKDEEIFCTDVQRLIVSYVLPIVLVVLVMFAAIIVMLLYKERILIWLYAHPAIRKFFPVDLEDEDKHYDAFISYAEADSDYIANQLLPGLEESSEIRYKCLVHVRDFVPGRGISEQIIDAVENSRRTVIVLSKKFVASDWARLEFEAAHSRKKVIVIVYGDLPSQNEMGVSMWDYIQTNTYVKHDDPWFWEKLRYALPHRGGWSTRRASYKVRNVSRRRRDTDQMQLVNGSITGGARNLNVVGSQVVVNANGALENDLLNSTPPSSPNRGLSPSETPIEMKKSLHLQPLDSEGVSI